MLLYFAAERCLIFTLPLLTWVDTPLSISCVAECKLGWGGVFSLITRDISFG